MVTVEELPRFPASIDEIAEEKDAANHRFAAVIDAAKAEAKAAGLVVEDQSNPPLLYPLGQDGPGTVP